MAGRTSKKDKKVTLTDVKEPNNIFEESDVQEEHFFDIMNYTPDNGCLSIREANIIDLERLYSNLSRRITGFCVMCKQILTKEFPEDYPMEWKFCCGCKALADHLILAQCSKGLIFSTLNSRRMLDKITLVG